MARRDRKFFVQKLVLGSIVAALLGAAGYAYSQRHVHRVRVAPGTAAEVTIEIPMERFGGSKSFAKEIGLPVSCSIGIPDGDGGRSGGSENRGGVDVRVLETGHTIHVLRARLRVAAGDDARPGRRKRTVEMTIDGQGGWPTATLIIDVGG